MHLQSPGRLSGKHYWALPHSSRFLQAPRWCYYWWSRVYPLRTPLMKGFQAATLMFSPSQLSVHGKWVSALKKVDLNQKQQLKMPFIWGNLTQKWFWSCWLTGNVFMAHYQFQSYQVHWSASNETVMGVNKPSLAFAGWHLGKVPVAFFYSPIKNMPCCLVCDLLSNHWGPKCKERECVRCVLGRRSRDLQKPSCSPGSASIQLQECGQSFPLSGPCSSSYAMNSPEADISRRF